MINDDRQRQPGRAIALFVLGLAMETIAFAGNKPKGQRLLYIFAGVMFFVAAGMRLYRARRGVAGDKVCGPPDGIP